MTDEVCKPSRVFEPDEVPVHASKLGTLKASGIHQNLMLEINVKQLETMFSEFRFMSSHPGLQSLQKCMLYFACVCLEKLVIIEQC